MNGFKLMADSYKKAGEQGKIPMELVEKEVRVFEFLGDCSQDDFYRLFDSGAFNDILKAYMHKACVGAGLDDKQILAVSQELKYLLDGNTSKEVCEN